MSIFDGTGNLQFDNDLVFDQEVGDELSDNSVVVPDGDCMLLLNLQSSFLQLKSKSILVDLFQKPVTQLFADLEGAANDTFSDFIWTPVVSRWHTLF